MTLLNKPLADYTPVELEELQGVLGRQAADIKLRQTELVDELNRRFGDKFVSLLGSADATGTARLPLESGAEVVRETKKDVKWDSAALLKIGQSLGWDRFKAMFKLDVSMSETIFKGIAVADPVFAETLRGARTVTPKPGAPRIERKAA